MKLCEIGTPVETLAGVGPSTVKLFAKQGIFTVADLLTDFPRDYEDRTKRVALSDWKSGKVHCVCQVTAHTFFGYGRMKTLKIGITDGVTQAWLVAFNRPFLEKSLPEGCIVSVTGTFQVKYNELQSTSFETNRLAYDGELAQWQNAAVPDSGVIPIYPLTEGLLNKVVHKAVAAALRQYGKAIDDELPLSVMESRSLLKSAVALEKVHMPKNLAEAEEGRRTIIFEELYKFEYKMALRTLEHRGKLPQLAEEGSLAVAVETGADGAPPDAAPYFTTPDKEKDDFVQALSPRQKALFDRLPFALTDGQMKSIAEMGRDIDQSEADLNELMNGTQEPVRSAFSMQRLLQGDVGSGKTLVSFFVCLRTVDYGGQCALLAPTELLARQHAENASRLLEPLGVRVAFLTGNVKASGRKMLLKALAAGEIDIVIGTHALFAQDVVYKKLQLAVIDEQHRFGVAQRESIVAKGRVSKGQFSHSPDVLMMSATPIPQTLALTVFGDLDVSTIMSMPQGRKPIRTYLSVMGHEANVYEAVRKELAAGHQAYFVYPRIGEGDGEESGPAEGGADGIKNAEEMFAFLSGEVYPEYSCALIHGKVDDEEQHKILDGFKNGSVQVLVATTVVEVGVDVPNATCMVIEHADRFGLAGLHQLRGRVGRGSLQSYCFLIYGKNITETGIARLKALHESNDGFKIAEEDLKLRGPGEVLGTAQSGYLSLGLADLCRDKELLMQARYDAFKELEKQLPPFAPVERNAKIR